MSTLGWIWTIALLCTLWFLPMGIVRMLAFQRHEVDRPGWLLGIAWLALAPGLVALAVLAVLTVWFLATGSRPA